MVSLVAQRDSRAWQRRTAGQQYPQLQFAGRCGGGVPKPGLLQDGDGADDRIGWPAVIRGRREQYRSWQYPQVQFAVRSSEVSEQYLGEGVGCGRAYREVRQWGSKPEQTQDGLRGWLPKRGAVTGH